MKKLKIKNGKAVLEETEKKRIIVVKPIYEEFMRYCSSEPIKVPIREEFVNGICHYCGNKYYKSDQKYCEKCGVEL